MKKHKNFISFFFLILLPVSMFVSCSKKTAVKQSFTFKVSSIESGIVFNGGSFVRAISPTVNNLVKLDAENSAEFSLGKWEFQTISYEGPGLMAGKRYCGKTQDIEITSAQQSVALSISEANCLAEPFISLIAAIDAKFGTGKIAINAVKVFNHQLIISGSKLDLVTGVKILGTDFNQNFAIESQSATEIIANGLSDISMDVSKVFNLMLNTASAAGPNFTIDFSLCNANLGGKSFNCAITPNDKDVLSFDATTQKWKPRSIAGLSYLGAWDANNAFPPATTSGEYYIVNVAHSIYLVGDWIVFNGTNFDRVPAATGVTNVFGRSGAIAAVKGDYILNKMGDVDLTTTPPVVNDVLKFNGTNWIPGPGGATETDPTVQAFAKATLPSCSAGQVLKSVSNTFSCVTDATGTPFSGSPLRAVATDSGGGLITTTVTSTELGYLSGLTSNVQTQLNTIGSSFLSTMLTGLSLASSSVISASDTFIMAFGKLQAQIQNHTTSITSKADTTNVTQTITALSVTGLSNPTGGSDAANKAYVDSQSYSYWAYGGSYIYFPGGSVGIGTGTPTSKLHVRDSLNSTSSITMQNTAAGSSAKSQIVAVNDGPYQTSLGITSTSHSTVSPYSSNMSYLESNAANGLAIFTHASGAGIHFLTGATPLERLTITESTGNTGIGISSPNYKLDVSGDINTTTSLRIAGTQICTSSGCTATSDRNLKENIKPLTNSFENILKLQGVSYDWRNKKKYGESHQIGLIAQDLEKIYPEVVIKDKNTGLRSVAYDHLIAPLIEAFKSFVPRVISLEVENAALKKENEVIKERLDKIEQYLSKNK